MKVKEIMSSDFSFVDILDGVDKISSQSFCTNQKFFPVLEDGNLVGIVSYKELMFAHPNRIIADVMNKNYFTISLEDSIWKANNIFARHQTDYLLVVEDEKSVGILDRFNLNLEIQKYYDPLTEMYTSTYLYSSAFEFISDGYNFSVLFIDINNFGKINKEYGHTKGDEVIKTVAYILKDIIPKDMIICRYGGDEFAILNKLSLQESEQLAVKLQEKVSTQIFFEKLRVGLSIGIASNIIFNDLSYIERISKVVNLASLASTKAKHKKYHIHIVNDTDIKEIA